MKQDKPDDKRRPRLTKETLRGLGFEDLAQVQGGGHGDGHGVANGDKHPRPAATRYCIS